MATVTGYTAARMKQIEDETVVDGDVVGGNLILKRRDLVEINAGSVVGPAGPQGPAGPSGATNGTVRIPHTFHVPGDVKVAVGDVDFIMPFYIPVLPSKFSRIVAVRHKINSGVSATFKVQANGVDVVGFTGILATTTVTTTDPVDDNFTDGQAIAVVITAVAGTPKNLAVTIGSNTTSKEF